MPQDKDFPCKKCQSKWTFADIWNSIVTYGYINLYSDSHEIFAFNCPDNDCFSLIFFRLTPDLARDLHRVIEDEINPAGLDVDQHKFNYFSTIPFSEISRGILKSFDIIEMDTSLWEHKEGTNCPCRVPDDDYYYSFNQNHLSAFNDNILVWCYRKNVVAALLKIESNSRIQLFPRYFVGNKLMSLVDSLYWGQCIAGSQAGAETKEEFSSLIPSLLYGILSEDLIADPSFSTMSENAEMVELQSEHQKMIEDTVGPFKEGLLNNLLINMADDFIQDYKLFFQENALCWVSLWKFKTYFLEKVYKACLSGELVKKTARKPMAKQIAKAQCVAVAELFWEYDPETTIAAMSKKTELVDAAIGEANEATRYEWIKKNAPNREGGRRKSNK